MKQGSDEDFAEYFRARARPLRRTAYALTGDWQRAEDLTQATFLRLYRHWRRIRRLNIDAYARRTLTNTFLDERKYQAESPREVMPDAAGPGPDLDARLDLAAALARLSPRMRAVIVLRYLEDLSVRETAQALGISEGTVKSTTNHALAALRTRATVHLDGKADA